MFQQDLYRQNDDGKMNIKLIRIDHLFLEEDLLKTSDTMKDANDTLTKDLQSKLQQSLLVSESEFVKLSPTSSINEPHRTRTPSPGYTRSTHEDHSSTNRYSAYDNRPIKPLDQNMLQSKLNQYPVENIDTNVSRPRASSNPQQSKRTSTHLGYNATRYSPKTTPREPTTSAIMRPKSNQTKRHTIAADNANTFHRMNRAISAAKNKYKHSKHRLREEWFNNHLICCSNG
jgi:hypothetical protein